MPALRLKHTLRAVISRSSLRLTNRRRRLEAYVKVDVSAVGDAALDTSRVVRLRYQPGSAVWTNTTAWHCDERIIVYRAGYLTSTEARANGEGLRRWYAHHSVRKDSLKLVETRLSKATRHAADDASHCAADAVVSVAEVCYDALHALRGCGFWASYGVEGVDCLAVDAVDQGEEVGVGGGGGVLAGWGKEELVADGGCECDDFDAVGEAEDFLGDGTGCYTTCKKSLH